MYYTFEWKYGLTHIADIDVEVYGNLDMYTGDPGVNIERLYIDKTDILQAASPTLKALALEIKEEIEGNADWLADLAESEGYLWQERGANDPEARWVAE